MGSLCVTRCMNSGPCGDGSGDDGTAAVLTGAPTARGIPIVASAKGEVGAGGSTVKRGPVPPFTDKIAPAQGTTGSTLGAEDARTGDANATTGRQLGMTVMVGRGRGDREMG